MARYERFEVESPEPGVVVVWQNRPEKLNAWDQVMLDELVEVQAQLGAQAELRAVVLAGRGRAFCTGVDMSLIATEVENTRAYRNLARQRHRAFEGFEQLEAPVIAAIHGYCLGGGLEVALACDFRIGAAGSVYGFPEIRFGQIPGSGGCSRLAQLVGPAKAKLLVMSGKPIDAQTALQWGLVEKVVPDDQVVGSALEFARELSEKAPLALGMAKSVINANQSVDWATARQMERMGQSVLLCSADYREGLDAYQGKRAPQFKAR